MINVLHLRDTDRVCGPGKTILESALAHDAREFNTVIGVYVSHRDGSNAYLDLARGRGLNAIPVASAHPFDPRILRTLMRILDEHAIDVVHSHEYKSDILTYAVSRLRRIPIMSTIHGWIQKGSRSKVYLSLARAVLPRFDCVVAVSEGTRRAILSAGVPDERVTVIHNAIVTENYDPATHARGSIRQQYGVPADARLVANIGRLSGEKGQRDFVLAAAQLSRRLPDVYFLVVGDGPDRAELDALVEREQLGGRVIFTGHLSDVRPVYADLDVLALTSYTEGFPNVVLEAMCMGKPVLATEVGGTPEIVQDDRTGVLIPPRQPGTIARELERLLSDASRTQRLARAGQQLVHEQYRFSLRVAKEEAVYRALVAGRSGTSRTSAA